MSCADAVRVEESHKDGTVTLYYSTEYLALVPNIQADEFLFVSYIEVALGEYRRSPGRIVENLYSGFFHVLFRVHFD